MTLKFENCDHIPMFEENELIFHQLEGFVKATTQWLPTSDPLIHQPSNSTIQKTWDIKTPCKYILQSIIDKIFGRLVSICRRTNFFFYFLGFKTILLLSYPDTSSSLKHASSHKTRCFFLSSLQHFL